MPVPGSLIRPTTARLSAPHRPAAWLLLALALMLVGRAHAEQHLDPLGGGGGGAFEAHCPAGQLLAGFDLHAGDDVDAIRPLCVTASGPRETSAPAAEGNWYGGSGGGPASVACNRYAPVVTGMYVAWEGEDTIIVNTIHLFCSDAAGRDASSDRASAVFDGPEIDGGAPPFQTFHFADQRTQRCPQGQVAVGVHGRSGKWLDAIGLICGAAFSPASSTPGAVTAIGKVNTGTPSPARPPMSICQRARDARARQSPAAADLQAQCNALRATSAVIDRPALATADAGNSMPRAPTAYLYSVDRDGALRWFRQDNGGQLQGSRSVDTSWDQFRQVFAGGDGVIYVITQRGALMRYRHAGYASGSSRNVSGAWEAPQQLASDWGEYTQAFSAGHGVIYAIARDGTLKWYRHTGFANGKATLDGPRDVGRGWNGLTVFSAGDGVIYTITPDGVLRWYRHVAFMTGGALDAPGAWQGRTQVAVGWGGFEHVFAAGGGVIYVVRQDGQLLRYRHLGYLTGASAWDSPQPVASGWKQLRQAFAQP
ncbi:MAG: tachylectin-related carbohydrate-binding protein [Pseudoxanthomonas sp.]